MSYFFTHPLAEFPDAVSHCRVGTEEFLLNQSLLHRGEGFQLGLQLGVHSLGFLELMAQSCIVCFESVVLLE